MKLTTRRFREDCECVNYVRLQCSEYILLHNQSERENSAFMSLAFALGCMMGLGIFASFMVIADLFSVRSDPFGAWAFYIGAIGIVAAAVVAALVLFLRYRRDMPLVEDLLRACHKKVDEILDKATVARDV